MREHHAHCSYNDDAQCQHDYVEDNDGRLRCWFCDKLRPDND